MDGLRGFNSLRTEVIERPPAPPKRHCERCNATLAKGTRGEVCMPCLMGKVDIPDWMIEFVKSDPRPWTVAQLAQMLTGGEHLHKELFQARNEAIADDYAEGGISQRQLAERWGLKRNTVQDILGRKGYLKKPAKKKGETTCLERIKGRR